MFKPLVVIVTLIYINVRVAAGGSATAYKYSNFKPRCSFTKHENVGFRPGYLTFDFFNHTSLLLPHLIQKLYFYNG